MLLNKYVSENGSVIAVWKIDEKAETLLAMLKQKEAYLPAYGQLKKERRQTEWLCSRLLVQMICGEDKIICYNEHGKPLINDDSFRISISHTPGYVALIAHPEREVGIDIEQISDRVCRLKERFLSKPELQHIDSVNEKIHLLLHWCAKEVLFKMVNRQHVDFQKNLRVLPFSPYESGIFSGKYIDIKQEENFTFAYHVYDNFVLVWSIMEN